MDIINRNFLKVLIFSLITLVGWSSLPIALRLTSTDLDAVSITWFRFTTALLIMLLIQATFGRLHTIRTLTTKDWIKLVVASLGLIINYVTFVWSLDYLGPAQAQLCFQIAPFFLAIGGLMFFRESIGRIQVVLFICLAIGLILFFLPKLKGADFDITGSGTVIGILWIFLSAFSWSCYALLQKSLGTKLASPNILLIIYFLASIALWPVSNVRAFQYLGTE